MPVVNVPVTPADADGHLVVGFLAASQLAGVQLADGQDHQVALVWSGGGAGDVVEPDADPAHGTAWPYVPPTPAGTLPVDPAYSGTFTILRWTAGDHPGWDLTDGQPHVIAVELVAGATADQMTGVVWIDYGGQLGHVKRGGVDVPVADLAEWIAGGQLLTVRADHSDPGHPGMIVELVSDPDPAEPLVPIATPAGAALVGTVVGWVAGGKLLTVSYADAVGWTVSAVADPPAGTGVPELVTVTELRRVIGSPAVPDDLLAAACATASAVVWPYLDPSTDPQHPLARTAALTVAVDVYQSRTAAGGQNVALDYSPGPYRMGRSLLSTVAGLIAPIRAPGGLIG